MVILTIHQHRTTTKAFLSSFIKQKQMRCKKHLADLSSSAGVCATCLRERLLALMAAQTRDQQALLTRVAENCRKPNPPPLVFPRSVSPYVSRRKSDENSASGFHHQRFFSTPQMGPTYSTTTTADFEAAKSFKKKSKFSMFSNLFRPRSDKFNSGAGTQFHRDLCDESSSSWFSAIFAFHRKQHKSSRTHAEDFGQFDPGCQKSCRVVNRGMSPAIEVDSGDECDQSPSVSTLEASPQWKRTPTAARGGRTRTRNVSGLAFCLSPLVRASPNRQWNQKGGLPPDKSFAGEGRPQMKPHLATAAGFCANRSRKLADFGRVNYNH
ncbi:hypothetical protein ERO13_D12G102500v2 [Gossypium hirsutum]|uniref:Uncharacterized protein n=1 Tax=Gossypium hirsutum TaxID=3635 RepID=A0A1U8N7P7_GOSHI|nr:uncharacterized protein LOC107945591 [Gossypium hirsutum]KAG4115414.1 hypothetical protein ERO13_D12G102500v2 [Gossypium hirsutum]